jgi:rod shape determining protein RodA
MQRYWILPALLTALAVLSLTMLRSIAVGLIVNQTVFFLAAAGIFAIAAAIPLSWWYRFAPAFYAGLNILLVATLLIGNVTRGSTRWIPVGNLFNIQPSQLAVPIVALTIAALLEKSELNSWKKYFSLLALVFLPGFLIFIEPDLGTTIIYMLATGGCVVLATPNWKWLLATVLGVGVALFLSWEILLQPYQRERITSFLGTDDTVNYHAEQALIAIGSGQVWGRGLGQGVQSHLRFLPERQTDFMFASLAEELGLVGSLSVLGLYGLLISFLFFVAHQSPSMASQLYVYAVIAFLASQIFVNVGMNIGILPITGITLPYLSYGGSSILSNSLMLGIIQSLLRTHVKTARLVIT